MTEPGFLDVAVRDLMTQVLTVVLPTTSISAAKRLTHDRHVGALPVVDASGCLLGVVSLHDLLTGPGSDRIGGTHRHVMHRGELLVETAVPGAECEGGVVEEVMTREVVTVTSGSTIREAVKTMVTKELHRVLVVDGGRLMGLLTSMDVLRLLVDDRAPQDSAGFLATAQRSVMNVGPASCDDGMKMLSNEPSGFSFVTVRAEKSDT